MKVKMVVHPGRSPYFTPLILKGKNWPGHNLTTLQSEEVAVLSEDIAQRWCQGIYFRPRFNTAHNSPDPRMYCRYLSIKIDHEKIGKNRRVRVDYAAHTRR